MYVRMTLLNSYTRSKLLTVSCYVCIVSSSDWHVLRCCSVIIINKHINSLLSLYSLDGFPRVNTHTEGNSSVSLTVALNISVENTGSSLPKRYKMSICSAVKELGTHWCEICGMWADNRYRRFKFVWRCAFHVALLLLSKKDEHTQGPWRLIYDINKKV